ncbi:hypothetical protein [Clostridium beijerinckii]|uniref:hypothetical protein n=1 Tax=Clostridium beijerinckii TaxID=1520 RepID=UPI00156D5224|nr:hypothetical protein [Clostridium beijerinckii]NRT75152.1 hypothetical protein [Clostridium beijerinckii]
MDTRKILIDSGSKITGEIGKALVGVIPGGTFIPFLGTVVGATFQAVFSDFANRMLSKGEEIKVGAAFTFAASKLKDRMDNGDKVRTDDWFFPNNENYRSSSQEILEGVIIKSKIEHEELKIKYLANIYANTAFSKDKVADVNFYLKIAENLTYRQLCFLACIHDKNTTWRKNPMQFFSAEQIGIAQEIYDLSQQGIIEVEVDKGQSDDFNNGGVTNVRDNGEFEIVTSWSDIIPDRLKLNALGEKIYNIMDLKEISQLDIEKIINLIKN